MKIICFGDSNTFGFIPLKGSRYKNRWPKVLQLILKDDIIIEDGMNGRTLFSTDIDFPINGFTYLISNLETNKEFDYFILMLGTNDLKNHYGKSPKDILNDIIKFLDTINNHIKTNKLDAKIIVCGIPKVDDKIVKFDNYENTSIKRDTFNELEKDYLNKKGIIFVDNTDLEIGKDGVHLLEESHYKLAEKLAKIIRGE